VIEDLLAERSARLTRVEVDAGEALPDWQAFDVVIAMGGPMGAYEDTAYPWLAPERALLSAAASAGTACIGVCLGAQLLAASIGGRAYPGPAPEIGVLQVELTAPGRADPVTSALPPSFPVLQWHGDTFDLPPDAVVLASSAAYPRQVYRWRNALGVQFHAEVTAAMARTWWDVPDYVDYLESALGAGAADRLYAELDRAIPVINDTARLLFGRFLSAIGVRS